MTLAQELEQTKATLANLQATVTASAAASETFTVKIAALEADKAALISEKETLAATISAHASAIETLKANAKTAEARAQEIAASVGVPPVAAQKQAKQDGVMSRNDFNQLAPFEQLAFSKAGGKLTE